MKYLIIVFSFLLISQSRSQQLYASISAGYQFAVGKENLVFHNAADFLNYNPWQWEKVDISLGKGVLLNGAIGYNLNQNYGFELGGSYLFGTEFNSEITSEFTYGNKTYTRQLSGTMIRVNPSFCLSVGSGKIKPYAKIGFILGVGNVNFKSTTTSADTIFVSYSFLYDGGLSFGASATFGINFPISKKIMLFGEFNFNSQSYAPKKGHMTEYIVNNIDKTEEISNAYGNIEIEFVDELHTDPTISPEPNSPQIVAKHSYPFNGYGLNIGVKFILWEKEKMVD